MGCLITGLVGGGFAREAMRDGSLPRLGFVRPLYYGMGFGFRFVVLEMLVFTRSGHSNEAFRARFDSP